MHTLHYVEVILR